MMNQIVSCTEGQDLVIYVNPDYDDLHVRSKFYTFNQNNSGGSFDYDDNLSEYVIIEAYNYIAANDIAESIGIYFDGYGDCACCGNRWSSMWDESDGTLQPQVYDKSAFDRESYWTGAPEPVTIHYLDGRVVKVGNKKLPVEKNRLN